MRVYLNRMKGARVFIPVIRPLSSENETAKVRLNVQNYRLFAPIALAFSPGH
jgi:hypothetical protein